MPKKPKNDIEKWRSKGWTDVQAPAGATALDEIPLNPETQDLHVFGQWFDENGVRLKGHAKPHYSVQETATGAVVSFRSPLPKAVTLLYKVSDEKSEDDD